MVTQFKGAKFDTRFIVISSILLVVLLACYVMAVNNPTFTLNNQVSTLTTFAINGSNTVFNISITAGAEGINITNITLPSSVFAINGSQAMSSPVAAFTNLSTMLSFSWYLNATVGSMINASNRANFFINLTAVDGSYTLSVNTTSNSSNIHQANLTIIFDTTAPLVTYNSPGIGNNWSSSRNVVINVSANDSYLNKTIVSIAYRNLTTITSATNNTNYAQLVAMNITQTLTLAADGNYTINVTAIDNAGNSNTVYRNITVDTTGPAATLGATIKALNLTGAINVTTIYSAPPSTGILIINATVADATMNNISMVYFNITNTATPGVANATFTAVLDGADVTKWSSSAWNLSQYPQGKYQIMVVTNDSLNNVARSEIGYVIKDASAPSLLTFSSVSLGQTSIVFTVNVTDVVGMNSSCRVYRTGEFDLWSNGNGTSQNITESGLLCDHSYTYNVNCTDALGNSNLTISVVSYTTAACDAASSSSSGSSSSASSDAIALGVTKTLDVGGVLGFTLPATATTGATKHTLLIRSIVDGKVTITVSSTPQTVTLSLNEEKKMDLNADNVYDILVKVTGIAGKQVDVSVKSISEAIASSTPTAPAAGEKTPVTQKVADAIKSTSSKTWWIVGIIIVIIAIVLYLVYGRKK